MRWIRGKGVTHDGLSLVAAPVNGSEPAAVYPCSTSTE
jgi:hypothetical protein